MRTWRWYSKLLLALVILAFAYWVWPTPWRYLRDGALRQNRFTGTLYRLDTDSWSGWKPFVDRAAIERAIDESTERLFAPVNERLDELDALLNPPAATK